MTLATVQSTDPRIERSRGAVLDAAGELLISGGVPAFTIESIVERSGVARSTIYRHWPTRRDLMIDTFNRLLPVPEAPDVDGPLRERLATLAAAYVQRLNKAPWAAAIPTILDAAARDPELAGVRERLQEQNSAPTRRLLEEAIGRGELPRDTDVDEAIAQLAGPVMFRHLILGEKVDSAFAERIVDLFLSSRGADGYPGRR